MARKWLESGKLKSSSQKITQLLSQCDGERAVGVEDWKKFGGVMVVFVKSIGHVSK